MKKQKKPIVVRFSMRVFFTLFIVAEVKNAPLLSKETGRRRGVFGA